MQQKTLSYEARTQLNFQWCSKDTDWQEEINYYTQQILINEQKMKEIDSTRIETEILLQTIVKNLSTSQTKINRNLIQLHRGFIMYGPPGMRLDYFLFYESHERRLINDGWKPTVGIEKSVNVSTSIRHPHRHGSRVSEVWNHGCLAEKSLLLCILVKNEV